MAKILLVEDEQDLAKLITEWLEREGHSVHVQHNGSAALTELQENADKYELLILDIMLPGRTGIDICSAFRKNSGSAPILMLSAKHSIEMKELAFRSGADDYVTKPFSLRELAVRVTALLRRASPAPSATLRVRDIVVDSNERKVSKSGQAVHLSPREFHLLEFLMKHPNHTFTAQELIDNVWDLEVDAGHDTVRGHINRLRKKLDTPGKKSLIANVYGFGYKLEKSDDKDDK